MFTVGWLLWPRAGTDGRHAAYSAGVDIPSQSRKCPSCIAGEAGLWLIYLINLKLSVCETVVNPAGVLMHRYMTTFLSLDQQSGIHCRMICRWLLLCCISVRLLSLAPQSFQDSMRMSGSYTASSRPYYLSNYGIFSHWVMPKLISSLSSWRC